MKDKVANSQSSRLPALQRTMFFFLALGCLCVFWVLQYHWKRRRLYKAAQTVPGPLSVPLIGSTYLFFRGNASVITKKFMGIFDDYPDIGRVWMGQDLYYFVTKPEYLELILNSPSALEKAYLYNYTKPVIGDGLLSSPVQIWKRHRKIIAPSLNQKILNEYVATINQQCIIMNEIFQRLAHQEIDHYRYITNCSMDIIAETLFGVPINAQFNDENYGCLMEKLFEIIFIRAFKIYYHLDFVFRWTKYYKEQKELIGKIHKLTRYMIDRKKEQLENKVEIEDEKKKPFLELVMEKNLNNEFSVTEVEDEVNTFLLAGSDTNSTTVSFILTLLGMHQDIQEQVYEEVVQVLGPERSVTLNDLSKLKYTERVIKESLRLFPGGPNIGRIAMGDISLGEVIIPKGASVIMGLFNLHRNEKYWSEPLKFDPDRFLPERSANRHPYTCLPFSGGPRNCIGMKFAMMVMKIMVATIIRKFKVTSPVKFIQDMELSASIVLKPKDGFRLSVHPR